MVKEFLISIFLVVFRFFFIVFKFFPQKSKTTFITSFGDNVSYVSKALSDSHYTNKIIILKSSNCNYPFTDYPKVTIIDFKLFKPLQFMYSIYHLATSDVVFVDNYFPVLAVTDFRNNVVCIQLWHAAGAIKKFGLMDPSINNRSLVANKRFESVYRKFDYVVVGSEKMNSIFQKSFGLTSENIVRSGIPRTDFFFNKKEINQIDKDLVKTYPLIKNKKVLMYAPTFREGQLNNPNLKLNIETLYNEFKDEFVLLLRLHPAVKKDINYLNPDFVIDVSDYPHINELLVLTDILITDYSSIPFEFSLLNKPMIFFAYDLENYQIERGFWEDYNSNIPGPVVRTTDEIIKVIKDNNYDMDKIISFSKKWNQYSKGNSSENIINRVYSTEEQYEVLK